MSVKIGGDVSGLQSAGNSAKSILSKLASGDWSGAITAGLATVATAAVGFGVASVKMAGNYEQSMNKVQALTGSSNAQMQQYDTSLKNLAVNAGVAPKALSDGLYNVLSAGYSGAAAIRVLTLATQDSKIGMTDAATTTQALTNVMANFKVSASDANHANGEMLETVTLGKASFSQYASNITKAASTSAQYSQTMETMNAAWSTLTASGISAGMATTDYDQSLKVMDGNIGKVAKSLQSNGIAFNETKFNAMSYGQQVVTLNNALQIARDKHISITGATAQASQAISTIAGHIGMYNSNLAALSDKQAMNEKTASAWAITQGGLNQQMSRLSAAVQVLMINLGNQLLPIFTNLLSIITPIIASFSNLHMSTSGLTPIFQQITGALGIMKANWEDLAPALAPVMSAFSQFGKTIGQLLPSFIGLFMLALSNLNTGITIAAKAVATIIGPALKILSQIFTGVRDALAPVVAAVTDKLMPALDNLVSAIAPVIANILKWIAKSGIITPLLAGIGKAISVVVTILAGFINGLASIIKFFTQTELGIDILKATLILLAIVLGIIAAVVLPGLIAGFVETAISAIATGISIALAFLPITLIVLGIIAVITLVILIISHWGDIAHWLQGVWIAALNGIQAGWSAVTGFLGALWDGIKKIVQNALNYVKNIIQSDIKAIVGIFLWLYNHNYYFKDLCDFIRNVVQIVVSWLTSTWKSISSFITGIWSGLASAASFLWSGISSTINNIVSSVVSFLSNQWSRLAGFAQNAWNGVTRVFSGAWGALSGVLGGLWNNISGWFTNLGSQMLQFGATLINMLAQGILNAGGSVGNAIHNAIGGGLSALGFHGIPGFANGVTNFAGGWAIVGERGPELINLSRGASVYPNTGAGSSSSVSSMQSNSGPVTITIMLDGKTIGQATAPHIVNAIRVNSGVRM